MSSTRRLFRASSVWCEALQEIN